MKNVEQNVKNQYIAAVVVNFLIIGYELHEGWSSPATILLVSKDSPMPCGSVTKDEMTWVTTLLPVGGAVGTFVYGYITNHFGRKTLLLFNAIPIIISWLLILFAQNPVYLYISRFLAGFFGGSSVTIATLMLSEIGDDRVRGILTSSVPFSQYFGIWLAYVIGTFDLNVIAIFSTVILIVFFISFVWFPESGLFLVKRNRIIAAEKSIRFYKNIRESDSNKLLDSEIDKLKAIVADAQHNQTKVESMEFSDFVTKPARRAIIIGIVLISLSQLNGVTTYYAAEIFEATGSNMSSNFSAIIVGIVPPIAVAIAMYLVDRIGRKPLMAASGIGTALSLAVLAVYMLLKSWNIPVDVANWIPLASYSVANFTASLGIQTLTIPIISEIMPEKIKNTGVSFGMTFYMILQILTSKYLLLVFEEFGFHWAMFGFATIISFGTSFILINMPETKGKSHEQIMRELEK